MFVFCANQENYTEVAVIRGPRYFIRDIPTTQRSVTTTPRRRSVGVTCARKSYIYLKVEAINVNTAESALTRDWNTFTITYGTTRRRGRSASSSITFRDNGVYFLSITINNNSNRWFANLKCNKDTKRHAENDPVTGVHRHGRPTSMTVSCGYESFEWQNVVRRYTRTYRQICNKFFNSPTVYIIYPSYCSVNISVGRKRLIK